jgi:hypothetical protein
MNNRSISKVASILLLSFLMMTCQPIKRSIVGSYSLKGVPTTQIQLKADSTFEFINIHYNPYLHPFDHPDENFLATSGKWSIRLPNQLILQSGPNYKAHQYSALEEKAIPGEKSSRFVFQDVNGDTVKILYVKLPNNSITARIHGTMPSYKENLSQGDTLEFHFYGYKPWVFVSHNKQNMAYKVALRPEYKPNLFDKSRFRIRGKSLIDSSGLYKFKKQ